MYDWANSVYSLVITTAIFPVFYANMTTNDAGSDRVVFWGIEFVNTQLYSYVLAASFFLIIVLSPILSGMADYAGKKLAFMKVFCYAGALGCSSLFLFDPNHLEWSMAGFFLANLGFWGSLGFYNAYLPEIAPPEDHDKLGARGYAMGYIGSLILLLICLGLIKGVGGHMTKWTFVLVGIWWVMWAQPAFRKLPNNPYGHQPKGNLFLKGYRELRGVANELKGKRHLTTYLTSFFLMSMAIQTIMLMAIHFADKEVKLAAELLILVVLMIQILAIPGAFFMAWLSRKMGNVFALFSCTVAWFFLCVYAFLYAKEPSGFYVAAAG